MSRKLWAALGDAATKDSPPADRENKNGHPPLDVASDILPLPVHDPTCGVSVGIRFYFASIAFDYLHAYYSGDAPFLFLFFFLSVPSCPSHLRVRAALEARLGGWGRLRSASESLKRRLAG
jgi:hypothetical protein